MTLVYSLETGTLLGQLCRPRASQPAGTHCVLTGRGRGSHYVDCVAGRVRLVVVR